MKRVLETDDFVAWVSKLKDRRAVSRIQLRIDRVKIGNFGDHKSVGENVSELRIDYGPGYRVYYTIREDGTLVLLLGGGTKKRQTKDINAAQTLVARLQ